MGPAASGLPVTVTTTSSPGVTQPVFWSVTGYGFLSYDDDIMVWRNPWVTRGLTADGVGWALTTFEGSSWSPLTWLSHMTDVQLFGLDAGRHHLMNLLFHVVNVLLVFLVIMNVAAILLRRKFERRW